jgi:hypothetical protein
LPLRRGSGGASLCSGAALDNDPAPVPTQDVSEARDLGRFTIALEGEAVGSDAGVVAVSSAPLGGDVEAQPKVKAQSHRITTIPVADHVTERIAHAAQPVGFPHAYSTTRFTVVLV